MKRLILALLATIAPFSAHAGTYTFSTTSTSLTDLPHGTAVTWGLNDTTANTNSYNSLLASVKTAGTTITGATLTITNLYDWANNTTDPYDALFINILGGVNAGITSKQFSATDANTVNTSWSQVVDPFNSGNAYNTTLQATTALPFTNAQTGSLLNASTTAAGTPSGVTWSDPLGGSARSFNLVIQLSQANLSLLDTLLVGDPNSATPDVGFGFAGECHYYDSGISLSVTTAKVPDGSNTLVLLGVAMVTLAGIRRFKPRA